MPCETVVFWVHYLCTPYSQAPVSFYLKPHMYCACVFSCNLPTAFLAERPEFLCATMVTQDTKIRDSLYSWPWRRTFSHCSCQDLNLRPFDHESGALPLSCLHAPYFWVFLCVLWDAHSAQTVGQTTIRMKNKQPNNIQRMLGFRKLMPVSSRWWQH